MSKVRVQITSRTGEPGTLDAQVVPHGDYQALSLGMRGEAAVRLLEVLEAALHVAADGLVTDISVLVYPEALRRFGGTDGQL